MPTLHTLLVVAGGAAVLWAIPGPALVLLTTRGVDLGPRGAVATALGLSGGTFVHVLAAVVGLSAVLTASAAAFTVVKTLGALYLFWLAIQRLRDPRPLIPTPGEVAPAVTSDRRALVQGFLINALNPKVAVFFLAFLPPFVDTDAGPGWSQLLVLGTTVTLVLLLGDMVYGWTTARFGRRALERLRTRARSGPGVGRYVVASIYAGLGVLVVTTGTGD